MHFTTPTRKQTQEAWSGHPFCLPCPLKLRTAMQPCDTATVPARYPPQRRPGWAALGRQQMSSCWSFSPPPSYASKGNPQSYKHGQGSWFSQAIPESASHACPVRVQVLQATCGLSSSALLPTANGLHTTSLAWKGSPVGTTQSERLCLLRPFNRPWNAEAHYNGPY